MIVTTRLEDARRDLFSGREQEVLLFLGFFDLVWTLQSLGDRKRNGVDAEILLHAVTSLRSRLSTLRDRLHFLDWFYDKLSTENSEARQQLYGGLTVRDFHVDAVSVMDAAALVISALDGRQRSGKYPSFGQILATRSQLSRDLQDLIDRSGDWWPRLREVRDCTVHRKYHADAFQLQQGFMFQVYGPDSEPLVTDLLFKGPSGRMADFFLYSTWATVEIAWFLRCLVVTACHRLNCECLSSADNSLPVTFLHRLDTLIERAKNLSAADGH